VLVKLPRKPEVVGRQECQYAATGARYCFIVSAGDSFRNLMDNRDTGDISGDFNRIVRRAAIDDENFERLRLG
jgi:hypothetical protein